jgi:hypothetical protein
MQLNSENKAAVFIVFSFKRYLLYSQEVFLFPVRDNVLNGDDVFIVFKDELFVSSKEVEVIVLLFFILIKLLLGKLCDPTLHF